MSLSLLIFILLASSFHRTMAQDHAIDLSVYKTKIESLQRGVSLDIEGINLGYTGFIGFNFLASQIELGRATVESKISTTYFDFTTGQNVDSLITNKSNITTVTLGGWSYPSDEIRGFGFGVGTQIGISKEYLMINGSVSVGYRLVILDKISIMPSIYGDYGITYNRNDLFESFFAVGYGGRLSAGLVF